MYTIEELNTYHKNTEEDFVCRIDNREEWELLNSICPRIFKYTPKKLYYLCPRGGYSESPYYHTISISDIILLNYEIY